MMTEKNLELIRNIIYELEIFLDSNDDEEDKNLVRTFYDNYPDTISLCATEFKCYGDCFSFTIVRKSNITRWAVHYIIEWDLMSRNKWFEKNPRNRDFRSNFTANSLKTLIDDFSEILKMNMATEINSIEDF